jgi:hypothetical protein
MKGLVISAQRSRKRVSFVVSGETILRIDQDRSYSSLFQSGAEHLNFRRDQSAPMFSIGIPVCANGNVRVTVSEE